MHPFGSEALFRKHRPLIALRFTAIDIKSRQNKMSTKLRYQLFSKSLRMMKVVKKLIISPAN